MADDFLTTYAPLANDIATATKLDPSVVLGIIDTETGHGQHVLGNNIFGISPGGRVAQYPDVQTGSQAFVSLMQTPRYASVAAAPDPASQAAALVKSGYNTVNPKYAATVAANAQNAAKVLGYEDNAPATEKDKALADPALQTTQQPEATTTPSASTDKAPSEKDKALADPALQVSKLPSPAEPPVMTFDEYGTPLINGVPPSVSDVLAAGAKAQAPTKQQIINALQPDPNMIYGSPDPTAPPGTPMGGNPLGAMFSPFARDPKTGDTHLTLPPLPRAILLGLAGGFGPEGMTYDPQTGTMNLTPEAQAVASLGATGLRFSGTNPLQFVPPGSMERAPIPADAAASILNPDAAARIRAAQGAPVPVEPPTVPTPFNTPTTASVPGVSAEAAAAAAQAKPTSLPTGVPVTTPEAPPGAPGGAAGAQVTPSYEAIHTPAEEAAYRANAEGQKLIESQKIGEPDQNMYIPGETVNAAEQEQTVESARELKALGIKVPEASQADKLAAENNDTLRKNYVANTAKGPVDIYNEGVQREADINADKATVFAPDNVKGPVDFAPVISHMEDVLNEPMNRQNSALKAAYQPLLERIKSANIEDPMEAWGLRRDIDRMTSKRAQSDDRYLHEVAHDLNGVSDVIDKQIEDVAPGYDQMLARYKEHSRAINEMTVLQGATDKLRGPGQKLTFNDFQRFMKGVVDSRMSPSFDLNPYKAISEANMQRLWNVRDSLRRSASAMDLARAAGSDTMPNIYDAMKQYAKLGGAGALHAAAGSMFGPGGNLAAQTVLGLGKTLLDRRAMQRDMGRMQQLLHPSTPLRVPPGQENPLTGAPP